MKTGPPALFPLFRSELQARILARVALGGGEESVAELASAIAEDPGNTARELARLERAGIVSSRRVGRNKLVRVNKTAPFYEPLRDLITVVLGPATVLAEYLSACDGIVLADIFGSWAARYRGEPGRDPADIDLLVVGNPDRDDLYDATQEASRRLNRPVNPVVISESRWDAAEEGFIMELRSRPRVPVIPAGRDGS
ncbi:ArsR family transcriptional regulator [Haloechinothrix salitolerans]|uniref:ArsR family transcriptional regulator n=1 Tax=Haloechinothrix salitolerans TaxID=926830 RepID=A0ABW2BUN4_9PSEU